MIAQEFGAAGEAAKTPCPSGCAHTVADHYLAIFMPFTSAEPTRAIVCGSDEDCECVVTVSPMIGLVAGLAEVLKAMEGHRAT